VTTTPAPLTPDQQTASQIIKAQLDQWGLSSLADQVNNLIRQGYGQDAITLQLEATPEYKQRFSANDARMKAGLPVLTPAQYVATEASYRQVLQQYGLPSGFHDQPSDLAKFIANDVSPSELNTRAQDAQAVWLSKDVGTRTAWTQMYGLSDGAAIASILDPDRALPIVQRMTAAAKIGGAALDNGLQADQARFEQYADLGVTQAQAQKAFGQIAQTFDSDRQSAARAGLSYSQVDAEQANLIGSGAASAKLQQVQDSE
jgi:hypothetical protein